MKKYLTLGILTLSIVSFTGCAAFTKGVETARGTVNGVFDTVQVGVDKAFGVVSKGAEAAQKISDAAVAGAKETTTPATQPQ